MANSNTIRIPYEPGDELVHTDLHPICDDTSCPCYDALRGDIAWKMHGNVREINQDEAAQVRNATTQCADGSWW